MCLKKNKIKVVLKMTVLITLLITLVLVNSKTFADDSNSETKDIYICQNHSVNDNYQIVFTKINSIDSKIEFINDQQKVVVSTVTVDDLNLPYQQWTVYDSTNFIPIVRFYPQDLKMIIQKGIENTSSYNQYGHELDCNKEIKR